VTLAVSSVNVRFQEACMRAYIDGDTEPTYLSSGTEDYFASSFDFGEFGPPKYYHAPIAGLTHHCWNGDRDGDAPNAKDNVVLVRGRMIPSFMESPNVRRPTALTR